MMIIGPSCAMRSIATMNPGLLRGFPRRRSILQWLADVVRALAGQGNAPAPAQGR